MGNKARYFLLSSKNGLRSSKLTLQLIEISPFHLLLFSLLYFVISFPMTVRGDDVNPLRLPSEHDNQEICPLMPPLVGDHRSCPVKCFRPDPVCGIDGKTYWCGCADARCAGIRVTKLGFCEVGNGGSAPVSGQVLLLLHIVWLILLGIFGLFGLL
ncbi:putative calcium-dependent protein kinase 17-like [Capsicum annuum]|uniref:Serine protease inhibitor, Kazal-type family protein n=1 Tax=Capsicum annuum TaxID=4072 RepID=A0A2G2ZNX0_CAPAN|nr:uncharacterized protein LOC107868891 [Capsicum annuum]KAF3625984.1 putative calcium-dependent protein kinase 17-like [Capsicum annuum]KAF3636570.1 putative calcium-dependent protein kinase 17-like [Capsicum annuum]PHT83677.1 hypothetical protein T459_12120 [Capsicum annuum]